MSDGVMITLLICCTLIVLALIGANKRGGGKG